MYLPVGERIRLNRSGEYYVVPVSAYQYKDCNIVIKGHQTKHPVYYYQSPLFLDTETSHNHDEHNPIGWIYQYCMEWMGQYAIGRSVGSLIQLLKWIYDTYKLSDERRVVIYVHNLSYDMTYLSEFLHAEFGPGEILALKSRKILSARFGGLEFRCSYLLSNMSLKVWGDKLKCNIRKQIGAVDYDLIRYPDTPLTIQDWEYMINDVASLKECVFRELSLAGDTIATVPLTSTGYVRRDCRRAARKDKHYRKWFTSCKLTVRCYQLLKWAFAGGLTHGNRFFGNMILDDLGHVDFKSRYPATQMLEDLPASAFHLYYDVRTNKTQLSFDEFNSLLGSQCCLINIVFKNLRLKKGVTLPYISKSKIRTFMWCKFTNDLGVVGTDNGRVINCEGNACIVCTNLDLYWIFDQYENDGYEVLELYVAEKGRVPECIRNEIDSMFAIKEGQKKSVFRDKTKNKLNGIYGMFATDVVRKDVKYDPDTLSWTESKDLDEDTIQDKLNKYYSNRNNFTYYAHGVWTTSISRSELMFVIRDVIGYESFVYADTDSCFYIESPEIEERIEAYNQKIIEKNKALGLGVPNLDGGISYYGTLDHEEHCKTFKFLHAKCYGYTTDEDELKITVAGVPKDNGLPEDDPDYITREQELGSLDNLADGFIFKKCGGTRAVYVPYYPTETVIDGHYLEYASACIILNTTKEMGSVVDGYELMEVV